MDREDIRALVRLTMLIKEYLENDEAIEKLNDNEILGKQLRNETKELNLMKFKNDLGEQEVYIDYLENELQKILQSDLEYVKIIDKELVEKSTTEEN